MAKGTGGEGVASDSGRVKRSLYFDGKHNIVIRKFDMLHINICCIMETLPGTYVLLWIYYNN